MIKRVLAAALLILGVGFTTTLAQSPSLHSTEGLAVWDATGKRIGNVIGVGAGRDAYVALTFHDVVFTLSFYRNTVGPYSMDVLYYETSDCTDQAYMYQEPYWAPLWASTLVMPDGVVWVPDPSGQPRSMFPNSLWQFGTCTQAGGWEVPTVPAIKLFNWRDYFTPPFSIR